MHPLKPHGRSRARSCCSQAPAARRCSAPAACSRPASPEARPRKTGGTLRVGIGGGGPTDNFDAALINGPSATTRGQVFYETLVWLDGTFGLHNWLCDQCAPNTAANVWTVRLKQGLEFHNGKTVTADDVLFSIARLLDPKSGATAAAQLGAARHEAQQEARRAHRPVRPEAPDSFFDEVLSDIVYIIPVGYNPKKPVSTGPWKFVSFTPGRQTELVPFANYWGVKPKVDKLVIVELPDDSARVNALLSGQVDVINQVPFAQVPVLKANGNLQTVVSQTAAWNPITMRVDTAPVQRRARAPGDPALHGSQAGGATALFGQGVPASDYYGRFDPSAARASSASRTSTQAKSLLKAAGKQDLKVELVTSPISAGIVEACQVLAQNAKAAGIEITLRKVDVSTYFGGYGKWPFAVDYWVGLPYLVTASLNDGPGANRRQHDALQRSRVQQALQPGREDARQGKRAPIVQQMQKIQFDRGGNLIWSFQNTIDAYSKKVTGFTKVDETGWGLGRCQLNRLSFD